MQVVPSARRRSTSKLSDSNGSSNPNDAKTQVSVKRPMLPRVWMGQSIRAWVLLIVGFILGFNVIRRIIFGQTPPLVTKYLNSRLDSEDVALWRGTMLKENIPDLDTSAQIDLVVSHCDLPIDWIFQWAAPIKFRKVTIFTKCGKPVIGAPENAKIVPLDNVGRCDHTYAHFMGNYHSEANDGDSPSDYVLFLKDNDNSHRERYSRHKDLKEMIPLTKEYGFSCHEESNWIWSESKVVLFHPVCQISFYHDWDGLGDFKLNNYSRLRRDDNFSFMSQHGNSLGEYAKQIGIKPSSSIVPVCYGGNFMAQSKQILNRSPDFWKRIESTLTRSNNILEGHFMERLWGSVLANPLQQEFSNRISRQAVPGICKTDVNHVGALTK